MRLFKVDKNGIQYLWERLRANRAIRVLVKITARQWILCTIAIAKEEATACMRQIK
jgi:hypothetical protein